MSNLSQATRGYLESAGQPAPSIVSASAPTPNTVVLTWSQPISLTVFGNTASAYVIIPPLAGVPVDVVSVLLLDPTHLQLTTTDQTNGASYQLDVSQSVVENGSSFANFATSVFFTGNNSALSVIGHRLVDSTDIIVIYSRAVQPATANISGNYVFIPSLAVNLVERITDVQYLVRTARMQPNTFYTLTVSNVLALDGSSI
jgi:hypothetical protein